jgi:hypothetical protein
MTCWEIKLCKLFYLPEFLNKKVKLLILTGIHQNIIYFLQRSFFSKIYSWNRNVTYIHLFIVVGLKLIFKKITLYVVCSELNSYQVRRKAYVPNTDTYTCYLYLEAKGKIYIFA